MEREWLRDALFGGMTGRGYRLGTVLSLSWFWYRVDGCCVLYGGRVRSGCDFSQIIGVANRQAELIGEADYIEHEPGSGYEFVIRRFSGAGEIEKTSGASVVMEFDEAGALREIGPNGVLICNALPVGSDSVEVLWYYCPLCQRVGPEVFNVYSDNGTGTVDYGEPIGSVDYRGKGLYRFPAVELSGGRYRFAVKGVDSEGVERGAGREVEVDVGEAVEQEAVIVSAESL